MPPNPIEPIVATVRLRTKHTKCCGTVAAIQTMFFKRAQCAKKGWNRLAGAKLIARRYRC